MRGFLTLQLALRYLRGKRSANAVPVLSRISMVAIGIGAAAMIILFSVFNGFEGLVKENYKAFYPDLRITPKKGKFFAIRPSALDSIAKISGVQCVTTVIEDNVLAREDNMGGNNKGNDNQIVVTLKGIDRKYMTVNDLHPFLLQPIDSVSEGQPNTALVGEQIMKVLGLDFNNMYSYLMLYYLNPSVTNPEADPEAAFQSLRLHPAGAFSVLEEFDSRYILAPLSLAQQLFHAEGQYSSIEIKAVAGQVPAIRAAIHSILGDSCRLDSRYEQNKTMYMVMNTEKWAVYFILLLVLLIASFNMVGALSMLVLEKQKDLSILRAMGMHDTRIIKLVLTEGVLWALTGGCTGIILGSAVCLIQEKFGVIKIKGSFLVDSYPVRMQISDLFLVFGTIVIVGLLASIYPALRAARPADPSLKSG